MVEDPNLGLILGVVIGKDEVWGHMLDVVMEEVGV